MFENLTAEQLLNFDFGGGMDTKILAINLIAYVIGVLLNSFREMKKEGIGFVEYWKNHGVNSLSSIGALIATFVTMITLTPAAPVYAYFSMAFVGDALVNKAPSTTIVASGERGLRDQIASLKQDIESEHKQNPLKVIGIAVSFVAFVVVLIAI